MTYAERKKKISRDKRVARYELVLALHQAGMGKRAIARELQMSRHVVQWNNAKAESFFKTLKREEVYLNQYQTFAEAEADIAHSSRMCTIQSAYILASGMCLLWNLRGSTFRTAEFDLDTGLVKLCCSEVTAVS